jgi:hypothetical protein
LNTTPPYAENSRDQSWRPESSVIPPIWPWNVAANTSLGPMPSSPSMSTMRASSVRPSELATVCSHARFPSESLSASTLPLS